MLATIAFSLCSFLTGLASTFALLLGARMLMGAAEGGVMPISHAMVASEVDPKRRGLAQGVAQNLGSNLLGSFAAPVVLVAFAEAFGWREAFYLAGVPGIISAILIWFLLKEPAPMPKQATDRSMSIREALKERNMWICVVVGVLMVAHFVTTWAFMPLYLVQTRGFDEITGSWIMGSLGIAAAIYSFVVSGLSDVIGRKPVMVILPFLSVVGPLAAMYYDGPPTRCSRRSSSSAGRSTACSRSSWRRSRRRASARSTTRPCSAWRWARARSSAACSARRSAAALNDTFGVNSFLWMLMVLAVISGFVAMGLKETAPAVLARRGLQPQAA